MTSTQSLYDLLPVIHRMRDVELGSPLRGLLAVVEGELRRLSEDVDQLYDNWFVETCEDWVVPYLGDLLGVKPPADGLTSQRALVADTLRLRRRKGTPAGLELLARDVTGWPAHVVEYFQLVATTQHVDHVRLDRGAIADLREAAALDLLESPFSAAARTADVRHVDVHRGCHNIPSVGLHLWRLASYPVEGGDAGAVDAAQGRWNFDPAGRDIPLFNHPAADADRSDLSTESDLPGPLSRRLLAGLLDAPPDPPAPVEESRCPALPERRAERSPGAVVRVWWDGSAPSVRLRCCDLSDWARPTGDSAGPVSVDPVLGRLALPNGVRPGRVQVDYSYGFPGDLGAGPWDRRALTKELTSAWPDFGWQVGVSADDQPGPGTVVHSLSEAVALWRAGRLGGGRTGVIALMDSATYREEVTIELGPGERLLVVAATWPTTQDSSAVPERRPGEFDAAGLRPHLAGSLRVLGQGGVGTEGSELILSGLSIEGRVVVCPGGLARLALAGCTLGAGRSVESRGTTVIAVDNPELTVELERTVGAAVRLRRGAAVRVVDSILSARGPADDLCVDAPSSRVEIESSTVLGRTTARSLTASNAILLGSVDVRRRQLGWVRYSYLPAGSQAPRRYRCQPDPGALAPVTPRFVSRDPDDPRFGQLHEQCSVEIRAGADDESEMGAYHFLQQRRRVANLSAQLSHYLPFGLEAGVFFAT
ncbi:MAG TPA: phage tail protein [Microlunatus sp.]